MVSPCHLHITFLQLDPWTQIEDQLKENTILAFYIKQLGLDSNQIPSLEKLRLLSDALYYDLGIFNPFNPIQSVEGFLNLSSLICLKYDPSLLKIWPEIRQNIENKYKNLNLPEANATPNCIRIWLHHPSNSKYLEHITEFEWSEDDEFQAIPRELTLLPLKALIITNTQIKSLPYRFFDYFPDLERVTLCENRLSMIPDFDKLSKLMALDLNTNQFSRLPSMIHCQNLRELSISSNFLLVLPELPPRLQSLEADGINLENINLDLLYLERLQFCNNPSTKGRIRLPRTASIHLENSNINIIYF